jgi:hypothetical protein
MWRTWAAAVEVALAAVERREPLLRPLEPVLPEVDRGREEAVAAAAREVKPRRP